jgi:CDP-diacylglycerol--glycerol-3-phosphate 3-phosphatidyltransferase
MSKLDAWRKSLAGRVTLPIVRLVARTPMTPNAMTWLGFVITLGAAALIVTGHFLAAGIVVIVAGAFDMLDGALARLTGRVTKFGGILDSTLDRLSDAAPLLGLLWVFADSGLTGMTLLAGLAIPGSLLVSYVRARAEVAGIECHVGLFTRPERLAVLALGLLLSQFDFALAVALALVTVLSYFTAGQRLFYAWRQTRG